MSLVLRYAARSDRGLVRSNNEDSVYAGARLLALADGMGGHAAGEVASQLVVAALSHLDDDEPNDDLLSKLNDAICNGNSAIAAYIAQHPEVDGMGTTLDAILFAGNRIGLAHIGDSRTYLLRGGELTQITKDDTFVQTLVDEGQLTPEEAHSHPQRSLIMRALTGHETTPTLTIRETQPGDRYLLCSDGLSDPVSDETIREALLINNVDDAALRLIELALRSGGPDNVTVIVADVVDIDYGQTKPIVAGALCIEEDHPEKMNTAAGRASIINTQPKHITKRLLPQIDVAIHKPQLLLRRWLIAGCILASIIAVLIIGFPLVGNSYYITAYHGNVAIMRGIQGSFLGIPLQHPHKLACIDKNDVLSLVAFQQKNQNISCQVLDLNDLKQAKREQIITGLPTGTFNDINNQLNNLAKDAILPICTSLEKINSLSPSTKSPPISAAPNPTPQIGVDCRAAT